MGQVASSDRRGPEDEIRVKKRAFLRKLKPLRKQHSAKKRSNIPDRSTSHDGLATLVEASTTYSKDASSVPLCDSSANKQVPLTWDASYSPTRLKLERSIQKADKADGVSEHKAIAFIKWAQAQCSSKQISVEDFILQHCRAELAPNDTLTLSDLLAAQKTNDGHVRGSCSVEAGVDKQRCVEPFVPYNGHLRGAPKPHCHEARVAAADGINALRATRDGEIEAMLRLLCHVFQVETSTVALLTGEAIYITGACGALQPCVCPDRWGFCGWSFLNCHHELLVVEDMDSDARFSENYFVVEPQFHLKFYVAAPLVSSNGHRLGTLCIMGQEARRFDALKAQMLANLAEMLVRQLEYRWVKALQESGSTTGLQRSLDCCGACYFVLDLSASPWRIVHMNEPARTATGVDWGAKYDDLPNFLEGRRGAVLFDGLAITSLFDFTQARLTWGSSAGNSSWEFQLQGLLPAADAPASLSRGLEVAIEGQDGVTVMGSYKLTCKLATSDGLDESQPFYLGVPSWLALSENNTWGRNYFFARLEVEAADGSSVSCPAQKQQERLQPQRCFQGDSVAEIMTLAARALVQQAAGSDSGAGSVASSSPESRRSSLDGFMGGPVTPCWLPRGVSPSLSTDATTPSTPRYSNSEASLPSTPPTGALSHAPAGPFEYPKLMSSTPDALKTAESGAGSISRASSVKSAQTVTSSGTLAPVVQRGLPIPGLLMGPIVGRGSYGKVYRGLWRGRPVAVKIIDNISSLQLTASGEPLEVSLTKDLKHTGIMSTVTYTYSDASLVPTTTSSLGSVSSRQRSASSRQGRRVCWMLFEYCDKGILADAVIRGWFRTVPNPVKGAPHLRVIGLTALEIAVAMKHLHEKGVMHGDLCGGNVMLSRCSTNEHGFTAKVGDFGLARIHNTGRAHPVEQRLDSNAYGTITHQPPEVLLDGGEAFTPAADVYAWGVLLWEMLTGTRAWAGMAAPAVVCQVAVLKRSLAIPSHLPETLETLLRRALSPKPGERPSFSEIVLQLTQFVQNSRAVDWVQWQGAVNSALEAEACGFADLDAAPASTACPLVA